MKEKKKIKKKINAKERTDQLTRRKISRRSMSTLGRFPPAVSHSWTTPYLYLFMVLS